MVMWFGQERDTMKYSYSISYTDETIGDDAKFANCDSDENW